MALKNYPKIAVGIDWVNDGVINWATIENVSEYVMSAEWQLGTTSNDKRIPDEGTATIVLNNESAIFSPENSTSSLYGYMKTNRLVAIYLYDEQEATWVRMWTGYVGSYQIEPMGTAGNGQATINCYHGLFTLGKNQFRYEHPVGQPYADDIIRQLFSLNGWRPPLKQRGAKVGSAVVGSSVVGGGLDALNVVEEGTRKYFNTGEGWGSNEDSMRKALESIAEAEQGFIFIDRDGLVSFRNKGFISRKKDSYDKIATTESNTSDMSYQYVDKLTNTYIVSYYPNMESSAEQVFVGQETIKAGDSLRLQWAATRDDGTTKSIQSINTFTVVAYAENNPSNDISSELNVAYEVTPGKILATISNGSDQNALVDFDIRANVLNKTNGLFITRINDAKFADIDEIVQTQYDNTLLQTNHAAVRFAEYQDVLETNPYGQATSVELRVRDYATLNRIIEITMESVLYVVDTHVSLTKNHLVIGEKFKWSPGRLSAFYTLYNIAHAPDVSLVGTAKVGTAVAL